MQNWSKFGVKNYFNVDEQKFLIQYFTCEEMTIIKAVGIGCYINAETKALKCLVQIHLKHKSYAHVLQENLLPSMLSHALECEIYFVDNIFNYLYDDRAWTLSLLALFNVIEPIDTQQHMIFLSQLNQLIIQFHQDSNIKIKDKEVITTSWIDKIEEESSLTSLLLTASQIEQEKLEIILLNTEIETRDEIADDIESGQSTPSSEEQDKSDTSLDEIVIDRFDAIDDEPSEITVDITTIIENINLKILDLHDKIAEGSITGVDVSVMKQLTLQMIDKYRNVVNKVNYARNEALVDEEQCTTKKEMELNESNDKPKFYVKQINSPTHFQPAKPIKDSSYHPRTECEFNPKPA